MSAQPHGPAPHLLDKTFTGVRAALFHPDDTAPEGAANTTWLTCAAITHNLLRA